VAEIRERIAVNKHGSNKFHMERFNLKKINEVESKVKYCVEVSNRFTPSEDLDVEVEINAVCGQNFSQRDDVQNYWTKGIKLNCSGYRFK
jgi:hypothetical protein